MAAAVVLVTAAPFRSAAQTSTSRPESPPVNGVGLRSSEPRVAPLPESEWTPDQRAIAERYASFGSTGNVRATLLRVPELAESIQPFLRYTSLDSTLSPRHRAIVILRTAWLAQNAPLWTDYAVGVAARDLRRIAVGADAEGWDAFETRLVRLVDELFINSSVTDATWTAVAERYDAYNMVDLVMTVAELTTVSVLLNSLGVQPDGASSLPSNIDYRVTVPPREPPLTTPRLDPIDGQGLRVIRTIARHPQVLDTWGGNTTYVNRLSPLTPHDRELLILRIGWNCQAEYEWAKHVGSVGRARDHGLEPRRVAEGPDAPGWEPHEVALLVAADEMYRDAMVSDDTWRALASHYNSHEMMSIVMTVATYRFVSMTLNAFGVQLRPDDEGFPSF